MTEALRTFPSDTSDAIYGISPPGALDQDSSPLEEYTELLNAVEEQLVLPSQDLIALIVWAGNPG